MHRLATFIFLAALSLPLAHPSYAQTMPGYDRFDMVTAHRARPVAGSIWYPAGSNSYSMPIGGGLLFEPTMALMAPAMEKGAHPLILLSHGSGGNSDTLGWLTSGLVAQGAIVVAVDHPGSTTGDSSPRRSQDLRMRAKDISAALDMVLSDAILSPFIDQDQISAVGFSLGGSTVLGIAGLRFDGKLQDAHCTNEPNAADCWFYVRAQTKFAEQPGFSANAKDARVTRVVAIDPGFAGSVTQESLSQTETPVHFINLGRTNRTPAADVGPTGHDLVARLPEASYSVIAPANHFTFLAPCKSGAEETLKQLNDDPICTDPEGVARRQTHQRLIADIAAALKL